MTGRHRSRRVLLASLFGMVMTHGPAAAEPFELIEPPFDDAVLGLSSQVEFLSPRGQVSVLVVYAQFADEIHLGDDVPDMGHLFDPEYVGSLTHFYDTMSFGQLRV